MQGEHLVVDVPSHEVGHGAGQFCADRSSESTTDQVKNKSADEILQSDHFVINAETQVPQPACGLKSWGWGCAVGRKCGSHLKCWRLLCRLEETVWRYC